MLKKIQTYQARSWGRNKINSKNSTATHIIIKFLKTNDKNKESQRKLINYLEEGKLNSNRFLMINLQITVLNTPALRGKGKIRLNLCSIKQTLTAIKDRLAGEKLETGQKGCCNNLRKKNLGLLLKQWP